MTCLAERYGEYAVPLIILALAYTTTAWREMGLWQRIVNTFRSEKSSAYMVMVLMVALGLTFFAHGVRTVYDINRQQASAKPIHWGEGAGVWMRDHLPTGTLVMNLNWGNFPELFYWDDAERYAMGLDPRLMNDPLGKKFLAWQKLYTGTDTNPRATLQNEFLSSYVLVNSDMGPALTMMATSGAQIVYRDHDVVVYDLR